MQHALLTPSLASRPRQGVGTRLARRIGGVVRSALACLRRTPPTPDAPAATQAPQAPAARRRAPNPRRPVAAAPAEPARRGWLARWFGHGEPPAAGSWHLDFPEDFTPENHPGFSAEECAILNTPAEELPPELLRGLLTAAARAIAQQLPPELGLDDPQTLFAGLWTLMAAPLDDGESEPDAPADAISATPMDAAPETPIDPPDTQSAAPSNAPDGATTCLLPASDARPKTSVLTQRASPHRRRRHHRRRTFPSPSRDLSRDQRDARQQPLPPRRVYNACTGPP